MKVVGGLGGKASGRTQAPVRPGVFRARQALSIEDNSARDDEFMTGAQNAGTERGQPRPGMRSSLAKAEAATARARLAPYGCGAGCSVGAGVSAGGVGVVVGVVVVVLPSTQSNQPASPNVQLF